MSKIIQEAKAQNREAWLHAIAEQMTPRIEEVAKKKMPKLAISMGFPSSRALSKKKTRMGECWTGKTTKNGVFVIMISPLHTDTMDIVGTVAHEQIHACVGLEHGHKMPFARVAYGIGLKGKPTETEPGPEFIKFAEPLIQSIGYELPHSPMNPTLIGRKVQPTRLLKVQCNTCDYIARVTSKWIEEIGTPICPCNMKPMKVKY